MDLPVHKCCCDCGNLSVALALGKSSYFTTSRNPGIEFDRPRIQRNFKHFGRPASNIKIRHRSWINSYQLYRRL
ncbi:unnamed protein product [Oikopleura dioica]|uniref:Uncharacterized protein n=1 Tax=Oikopleura dioica TaxID=34765 RepID=E4Z3W1_OIKDI|nr:unnamed protein product [Oikopleura dioica]